MSSSSGQAAPAVLERPQGHPRENVSNEIWNVPNMLTLFRIFLVPFLVVVLLTKFTGREFVGLGIFLLAAGTDYLDGYLARRTGKITRLGTLLDPIADKLLTSAAFISLVEMDPSHVPAWMVVIIIGREFAVSGLRSIAAQQNVDIPASSLGKGKLVSQVIAISLLILGYELGELRLTGTLALWAVMLFALASAIDYFIKFTRVVLLDRPSTGGQSTTVQPPTNKR
ncbi:MAG TPA: CDP-diacylglycerol--glycerol-3-phosphate 3-phosphatidyltransferase [Thermoanaerobaculia bacterium]|nr:CDP-diacylglycerol--glycerol-3-phosphate 3-phosphatidyltransferase [Thermoanaerobaculia bacterium]